MMTFLDQEVIGRAVRTKVKKGHPVVISVIFQLFPHCLNGFSLFFWGTQLGRIELTLPLNCQDLPVRQGGCVFCHDPRARPDQD